MGVRLRDGLFKLQRKCSPTQHVKWCDQESGVEVICCDHKSDFEIYSRVLGLSKDEGYIGQEQNLRQPLPAATSH